MDTRNLTGYPLKQYSGVIALIGNWQIEYVLVEPFIRYLIRPGSDSLTAGTYTNRIPSAYRPKWREQLPIMEANTNTHNSAHLIFNTNGDVEVVNGTLQGGQGWLSGMYLSPRVTG